MRIKDTIFRKLADPYSPGSLGHAARTRRMEMLLQRFPDFRDMKIVDLGGNTKSWLASDVRPAHVTVVDSGAWALEAPEAWMTIVQGDACARSTISGTFDLVFSNSLIEHVGGPRYRREMAQVVHDLAPYHWVQTPYRYFPVEPHFLFPGFQFLPVVAKMQVFLHWPLVRHIRDRTYPVDRVRHVIDHDLLTVTEMVSLFPSSLILHEKAAGMTKSLIAVRCGLEGHLRGAESTHAVEAAVRA